MRTATLGPARARRGAGPDGRAGAGRAGRRRRAWSARASRSTPSTRGLSTGLVEARDWASGTSSRSSKLIHGGLRYLEMLDFALVREALQERGLLLERLAPHLVRPVPFLYPLQHKGWERLYVGPGVALYDAMSLSSGHGRGLPRAPAPVPRGARCGSRPRCKQGRAGRRVAVLRRPGGRRALRRDAGAHRRRATARMVANRARVVGFLREGERVVGARVRDVEAGGEYEVRAQQVVNATGVWTDDTQALIGERGQFHVRASKGIHLVVPKDRIHSSTGLILRTEKSRAVRDPVGPALDHRHHRHRLGPGQGPPGGLQRRHRLPARARERGAVASR